MVRWLVLLVGLGGCDYVLGLKTYPDAAPGAEMVAGTFARRWIENDGTGAPVKQTAPPKDQVAIVTLDDGTKTSFVLEPDGSFAFRRTGNQRYTIELDSPYGVLVYDLDAASPKLVDRFGGRIDRMLVPPSTSLTINFTGQMTPSVKDEVHSTGVWGRSTLALTGANSFRADWTSVQGANGVMGLLDGMHGDDLYYAHYSQASLSSPVVLDAYVRFKQVDLVGGQNTAFLGSNPAALPATACAHVVAASTDERKRVEELEASSASSAYWAINDTPDLELAPVIDFPLAYAGLILDDIDAQPMYASPHVGHTVDALLAIVSLHGMATTVTSTIVPVTASCPDVTTLPTGVVAIPTKPVIAGTAMTDTNNQTIAIDHGQPVSVTWQTSATGHADIFMVKLQETGIAANPVDQVVIWTTRPAATIDPARIKSGHTYRLEIVALVQYPNASSSGDLDTYVPASSLGLLDTGTFTVP